MGQGISGHDSAGGMPSGDRNGKITDGQNAGNGKNKIIMLLNPKEEGRFYNFFCFITDHKKSSYKFVFADGEIKSGKYFSNAESDNCLELDDPEYEEFWTVIFESIETGDLFEITYHNMPVEVWCDGIKIDFGE